MGFHVDMAELIKLRDAYLKDSTTAAENLDTARKGMNGIITSNTMYGEVGKAITNEINNSHNAIIVGLKDSYTVMSGEFSSAVSELQSTVGETNESAILDEEVMTQTGTKVEQASTKHGTFETDISSIYSSISDLVSLSSPKNSVESTLTEAKKILTDAVEKVTTFDSSGSESQVSQFLTNLDNHIASGNSVQGLSYTDPQFTHFASYTTLAERVKQNDDWIEQEKKKAKEAEKKRLKEIKDAQLKEQEEWANHHPVQAMIKSAQKACGDWWKDVKAGTENLPPVAREISFLFEGIAGSAVGLIGDVAYIASEGIQFYFEQQFVLMNTIPSVILGKNNPLPTPQWVIDDVLGARKTELDILAYPIKLTYDADLRKQSWEAVSKGVGDFIQGAKDNPAYFTGGAIFEVGSLFIGVGEAKAGFTAAKAGKGFAEGAKLFTKSMAKSAVRNADDIIRGLGRLATRGSGKSALMGEEALKSLSDDLLYKTSADRLLAEVGGEEARQLLNPFSTVADDVAENSSKFRALQEGFQESIDNIANRFNPELVTGTAGYSDNILTDGVRGYNVIDDLAEGGRRLSSHFSTEGGESLVQHGDDIGNRLGETTSGLDSLNTPHWVDEASEVLTDGSHMDGKLPKPNVVYETGEHHYLYRTDEFGRIDRAYAEDLQIKQHEGRLRHDGNTPDKADGDHAGHIFGDLFGGSPELDNLVSQAKDVNLKEYRRIERRWQNALNSEPPKRVEVDIKINYEGTTRRPTGFEVNYKIDGVEYFEELDNINYGCTITYDFTCLGVCSRTSG